MLSKQTTFCNQNDLLNMLLKSGNYIMEYSAYQGICLLLVSQSQTDVQSYQFLDHEHEK